MMIPIQTSTISSLVPLGRLIEARVSAGFPSPADDYAEAPLSLDELTNLRAPSVFMIIVTGDSLIDIGVYDQDILVVDRSLQAMPSNVVIALVQEALPQRSSPAPKACPFSRRLIHGTQISISARVKSSKFGAWPPMRSTC